MKAVCHDQRNVISGEIQSVDDTGCILVSESHQSDPILPQKAQVVLNIVKGAGKSIASTTVRARVTGITRSDGCWLYRIRWIPGSRPEI